MLTHMFTRIRSWFDGSGWFVGLAVVLFAFAVLAVFLESQSPDLMLWTGHRVIGTEQGGIVSYRWQGQSYSLDASGYGSSNAVSVYLDPADPSNAMMDNMVDRVATILFIFGPVAGGVALLLAGGTRKYRWARRNARLGRSKWSSWF